MHRRAAADPTRARPLPRRRAPCYDCLLVFDRDREVHEYTVFSGTERVEVTVPGTPWAIDWGGEARLQGFCVADPDDFVRGRLPVVIIVEREDGERQQIGMTLLGPGPGDARVSARNP